MRVAGDMSFVVREPRVILSSVPSVVADGQAKLEWWPFATANSTD